MRRAVRRGLARVVVGYGGLLAGLVAVRLGFGDVGAIGFAANSLLLYAFAPLPLVLVLGAVQRRPLFVGLALGGLLVWLGLWGSLFLPRQGVASGKQLVVLTYNALGYDREPRNALAVIRDSDADLVALQELNPETAAAIQRELGAVYPYRWLEPQVGVSGGGILSKYPLKAAPLQPFSGPWSSKPMLATVDVAGTPLTFVRFHTYSGPVEVHARERQARQLAALARARRTPLVMAGDLNATDQNDAYRIVSSELHDAWREVGRGFGHTFPGEPTRERGGSRPTVLGIPVPLWLVRIDYVFYSRELRATAARLSPYAGGSDHRGVVVTLALP